MTKVKPLLLASVAALALSNANAAHAASVLYSETCGSSTLTVGDYSKDRDVSVHATYDNGAWTVIHTLSNGHVYDRGVQYATSDATVVGADGLVYAKWVGTLRRNPAIMMTGQLAVIGSVPHYYETMVKNGQTIMQSDAVCTFDGAAPAPSYGFSAPQVVAAPAPSYAPPVTASAPPPVVASQTVVALNPESTEMGGLQSIYVGVGSMVLDLAIDSGCTSMNLSETDANQLIASGQATVLGTVLNSIADGSTVQSRLLNINAVTIGGRTLTNVKATVGGSGLLGIGVLRRFGKFAIDLNARQLVLG